MFRRMIFSFVFWGAWIIIPVIMEIIPAFFNFFLLLKRRRSIQKKSELTYYPDIVIIVPVYNQEKSLFRCLKSIENSTYPKDNIFIYIINNGSTDGSFDEFCRAQEDFPSLHMNWQNAAQGKARAMNLALFNSHGKYIINIDSDGVLEKNAVTNMVRRFENNLDVNVMTGVVLTDCRQIKENKDIYKKTLQNLEYLEYAQAFLAGRSYSSETNSIYTLSGAFSAFRSSAILKSWLYNSDTICEDAQITFQMRYRQKERIECCEDAIFYTDPIESLGKLYTQRQRWQIGSLEVANMFENYNTLNVFNIKDVNVRALLYDHTFAFPRIIWYFALIIFIAIHYSPTSVILSMLVIFALYIMIGYFYFVSSTIFLREFPEDHDFYVRHAAFVALLPFYNLIVFFFRFIGIINGISAKKAWTTMSFSKEWEAFVRETKAVLKKPSEFLEKLRVKINSNTEYDRN